MADKKDFDNIPSAPGEDRSPTEKTEDMDNLQKIIKTISCLPCFPKYVPKPDTPNIDQVSCQVPSPEAMKSYCQFKINNLLFLKFG
jgi:hypothetical protein